MRYERHDLMNDGAIPRGQRGYPLAFALVCGLALLFGSTVWGEVTIRVFGLPDLSSPSIDSKVARAVLAEFYREHPDVKVVSSTGLSVGNGGIGLLMQIAGNIAPDVLYVNFRNSDTFIEQEYLYPLDEFVNELGATERAEVPAGLWPVIRRKGPPDDREHVYAWPTQPVVRALFYRRDLFQEAGLPDRVPADWGELLTFAKKLTDPAKGRYGLALYSGESLSWEWLTFLWSAGGDAVVQDANGCWRCAFDSEAAARSALYVAKLHREPWMSEVAGDRRGRGVVYTDVDPTTGWKAGQIGMRFIYLGYDYNTDIMNPDLYGIGPVPAGPAGIRGCELNSRMMGIYKGIKDPNVRRAAWQYISFWMSDPARKAVVDTLVRNGYGRFVQPELLDRFGYREYARMVPDSWRKAFSEAAKSGKPEPYGKNCEQIYGWMSKPLGEMLHDKAVLAAVDRGDDATALARIREILHRGVARANEKMLGTVPPETRRFRQRVAMVVTLVIAVIFGLVFRSIWRTFSPSASEASGATGRRVGGYGLAYVCLIPAVASIAVWQYYPLVRGVLMAFQDYRVTGVTRWVGLANFAEVFFDRAFWFAMWVTFKYAIIYLTFGFTAPIALAILLQEVPRGKMLFRTIYYLPAVTTGLVVVFLWKSFYRPDGLLNQFLGLFGMSVDGHWLDSSWALACCVLPVIWAGMGPGSLIYLAALKTVPDDLYEAASMDGAGIWTRIMHVTLPSIKSLVIINFIGAFIGAFQTAEFILAMTGGGPYRPYGETEAIGLHVYQTAFFHLRFGIATAMAWILGLMLIGFTLLQLRRLRNMEFRAAGV